MKVAFVGRVLGKDYWGGERRIALQIFGLLREMGLEGVGFHSYRRAHEPLQQMIAHVAWDLDPLAVRNYLSFLRKTKPDVVLGWYDRDTSLVYACKRLRIPLVLTAHVYWLQCPIRSLTFYGTGRFCAGPQLYCGIDVLRRRGFGSVSFLGSFFGRILLESFSRKLVRVNDYVSCIIACSDFLRRTLERDGFRKVKVVHDGVDPLLYDSQISQRDLVVLFSGQTTALKGFPDFLRMSKIVKAEFPQCKFVFTGGKREFMNGVEGLGFVDDSEMRRLYSHSSIFVLPSVWQEPFGLVIAEAMASGTPVVAYRTGAVPEIVVDGKNGFLVERGDVEQLSMRVLQLLRNPGLAAQVGKQARSTVENNFDIRETARRYAEVLLDAT
jgi:glycosyltransferase involved in cell wall biosynthesis